MKGKGNVLALRCFSVTGTSAYFSFTVSKSFENRPGDVHVEGLVQFIFARSVHVLELLRRDGKIAPCSKCPLIGFAHRSSSSNSSVTIGGFSRTQGKKSQQWLLEGLPGIL